jgi:SAM-dependent methyltransferase
MSLRARYVLTICVGSFLLFLIQPMIARMALPRLGGAPAVWNSAMLIYQALLLGGYAYAHALTRFAPRLQAAVHVALFALAALMLPLGLAAADLPVDANPLLWVPWLFAISIGPLFFMVAAQAPLMQRWFALSGGEDPYPLYSASNLGSFAGLIAYPLIVEPLLPLGQQSIVWSVGYGVLFALVVICALGLSRSGAAPERVKPEGRAPSAREIVIWMALAAIPSGLMLSTTTHLTTDIIAMPLLWVLPLGLYLLSFSVAFAERRGLADAIGGVAPIFLMAGAGAAFVGGGNFPQFLVPLWLALLFSVSVALHSQLYARRPHPSRLTGFYLAMSAGGALGGLFCALVAPVVFNWGYEHPLLILAAALAVAAQPLFGITERLWAGPRARIATLVVVAGALVVLAVARSDSWLSSMTVVLFPLIALGLIALGNRIAFTTVLTVTMLSLFGWATIEESLRGGARTRSFFGIYTVSDNSMPARVLVHGTTVHGYQSLTPGRERDTLSYYAPKSGVGLALSQVSLLYGQAARIGAVGLGSGTLACYAQPGQDWRFYEIDPAMAKIARDPARFSYLSRCLPDARIEIGDARMVIAREPAAGLDLLIVDAFSSDAIPMHLMTREALDTYARRLVPGGLLLMHISNRYLELEPVLAAARANGWSLLVRDYNPSAAETKLGYTNSSWVALARDPATLTGLQTLTGKDNWRAIEGRQGFPGWTDDYASIIPLLKLRAH